MIELEVIKIIWSFCNSSINPLWSNQCKVDLIECVETHNTKADKFYWCVEHENIGEKYEYDVMSDYGE